MTIRRKWAIAALALAMAMLAAACSDEAGLGVDLVGAEFGVAGEKIDFLPRETRDIEDGGGEHLLALEDAAFAVLVAAIEFVQQERAPTIAANEHDGVGLSDAELLRSPPVLIDVQIVHRDATVAAALAIEARGGGVGVFAEESADFRALGAVADGGHQVDGALEVEIGERFR